VQLQLLQQGFWSWFLVCGLSAWCAILGEREIYIISWLSIGSGTASGIILSVKVTVLEGGCVPMVG
jgi:hypothetical protein